MDQTGGRAPATPGDPTNRPPQWSDPAVLLVLGGVALIVAQLLLRGWAVLGGWFYSDDLEFLADATGTPLSLELLLTPHDSQLMPGGVLITWIVAQSGVFAWTAAAISSLALQLVANLSCWWALRQIFGHRWQVLVLLAAYLFWPLTFTSFMWWAAALNHVPLQAAAFLAAGSLVRHRRTGRRRWAAATVGAVVLGLVFYVKAALLVLPLTLLLLLYLTDWSAGPRRSATALLRQVWPWAVGLGVVVGGYAVVYATTVPSPLSGQDSIGYDAVADAMFRRSLAPVLLGGPWKWLTPTPPVSLVATPEVLATLALGLVAVVVATVVSRRRGSWRALVLVLPYLALAYALTARGRGPGVGEIPGLLLRYLADSTPWLVIGAGLLVLPLRGDVGPGAPPPADPSPPRSRERDPKSRATAPTAPARTRQVVASTAGAAVLLGCVFSSVTFAGHWRDFPGRTFVENVTAESTLRPLVVLDEPVDRDVADVTAYENTLPSTLLRPLAPRVRAVRSATDPVLLDARGLPTTPLVEGGAVAADGPQEGCGYAVGSLGTSVTTSGRPTSFDWWVSVSYFAGDPTTMRLELGDRTWQVPIERGAHRWFVRGSGDPGDLTLGGTADGSVVCVDAVDIGGVVPFGPA